MKAELPQFRKVRRKYAASIAHGALSSPRGSALLALHEYDDHHFRAVFSGAFFGFGDDESQPSKSQWNTLKKRLKRRERSVFIFRKYGQVDWRGKDGEAPPEKRYYIDFGFLLT